MHAATHKREAFGLAVEYLNQGGGYYDEPPSLADELGEPASVAIAITGLWASTDILPGILAEDVENLIGTSLQTRTYAAAARAINMWAAVRYVRDAMEVSS